MKYLFILDDACETMNWDRWFKMEALLDKYNILCFRYFTFSKLPKVARYLQKISKIIERFVF